MNAWNGPNVKAGGSEIVGVERVSVTKQTPSMQR